MCGIFGFWLKRELNELDIKNGKKCTSYLNHRGPDGIGFNYIKDKGLFIGHTRLSILDLSVNATQPMMKHNMIISFNGEIYNYLELKKFLITKGYSFFSESDTEVLLSSFDYWGLDAVKKFDGMFAIALYRNKRLYLISDNFLEKPLYYSQSRTGIYFSSEPQNLVFLLKLKKKIHNINTFISLGFYENGKTGYESLDSLPQSSIIEFSSDGKKKMRKYWEIPLFNNPTNKNLKNQFLDEFTETLITSIKRRLRSDVNVGLFLSSGLDSTLIATLLKFELKKDIDTFTFSFPGTYDESIEVEQFCKYLKLNNKLFKPQKLNSFDEKLLLQIFSYPNDNSTSISIKRMCNKIKKNYKVMLSGIGGDELTLGYNKYQFIKKYDFLYRNSTFTNFLINSLNLTKIKGKKIDLFKYYFGGNDSWKLIALKNGNSLKKHKKDFDNINLKINSNSKNFLIKLFEFDVHQTLPYSYLSAIDRGSMNESVEIRSPFLNKKLFQKINEINPSFLVSNQKIIFRRILERYLPAKLIKNQKKGFIKPVNTYSKGNLKLKKELKVYYNDFINETDYNSSKILSRLNLINTFFD